MIGTTLDQFRITAKLGEGGMGEVYRAEDIVEQIVNDRPEVEVEVEQHRVDRDPWISAASASG